MIMMVFGALAIGLTLGLLGSGGSILTVPVLVYVLGHDGKVAIAESLAIVGAIAFVGMLPYAKRSQVDWHSVLYFGLPGMGGTWLGAWLANFISGATQLILFAVVMLIAAAMMFRGNRNMQNDDETASHVPARQTLWKITLEGLLVGIVTGLVGVGGGFLIVPALVLLGGLPIRLAVGTSLVVVSLKSLSGFYKYLAVLDSLGNSVDWNTIAVFTLVGVLGSLAGTVINQQINQQVLKRSFAGFLVVMGLFVLGREMPHVMSAPAPHSGHAAAVTVVPQPVSSR